MNNIRLRTKVGEDSFLKVNLTQDFDFLEILSLKLSQSDVYRKFCADYGVVVGRVTSNNGFGIPNAKVSIFIPISEEDKINPELYSLYPFESVNDIDQNGVRYNLLNDDGGNNDICYRSVGTLPKKRLFIDNDDMLNIYCKYYSFTTTTNESGDYMIFGVPTGSHYMHVDCDISDIGIVSQKPFDLIRQGNSDNQFRSSEQFNNNSDISNLNQIFTVSPISVNVTSFWGDKEQCDIAITRKDIDLNTNITPYVIFMGSIFGDNEKTTLSQRCKPDKDLGKLNMQTTSSGKIEMIRETITGNIETYDGRTDVIDGDGTWAYQIPMNLDYMITDEFGNLTPTDDMTRGIATKARVRFRITMENNGEGPVERASYLVPHNPTTLNPSQGSPSVDYEFGESTNKESLAELKWNTIYSIKSFIPRYEKTKLPSRSKVRTHTGIKNVDSPGGDYTPFPYNRLFFQEDAMFSFLCTLVIIISTIIATINYTIVSIINTIISVINSFISFFGGSEMAYVPCITMACQTDEEEYRFAPGCCSSYDNSTECDLSNSYGCEAAQQNEGNVICTGSFSENDFNMTLPPGDAGLTNCIALSMLQSMELLEFDFYNDWVNGSLYAPLFRVLSKKPGDGGNNFCEWSVAGSGLPELPYTIDNDMDGVGDNEPYDDMYLKDTCATQPYGCSGYDPDCGEFSINIFPVVTVTNKRGIKRTSSNNLKEGLIVRYKNHYYYAPYSRMLDRKLFATDLITLGSSIQCNINGYPYVPDYFPDTTYKLPPYMDEGDTTNDIIVTSGMDSLSTIVNVTGGMTTDNSLFFDVNCFFFLTTSKHCGNLRRQCELGVGFDQRRPPNPNVTPISLPDDMITNNDIDIRNIRSVFAWMNSPLLNQQQLILDPNSPDYINTSYNDAHTPECGSVIGTEHYNMFRYGQSNVSCNNRTDNSFYFYFGLHRNKTAMHKLKNNFFGGCIEEKKETMKIIGNITDNTLINSGIGNGLISITVYGGVGPYDYHWIYPDGTTYDINDGQYVSDGDIDTLLGGLYTLTVTDSAGNQSTQSFIIGDPMGVACSTSTISVTSLGGNDGIINLYASGGDGIYSVNVIDNTNTSVYSSTNLTPSQFPVIITNLQSGEYTSTVTDSLGSVCENICQVGSPTTLMFLVNAIYSGGTSGNNSDLEQYAYIGGTSWDYQANGGYMQLLCPYGSPNSSGFINITPIEGVAPYTFFIENSDSSFTSYNQNNPNLPPDIYNITVTDSASQTSQGLFSVLNGPTITSNIEVGYGVIYITITSPQQVDNPGPYTYMLYDTSQPPNQLQVSQPTTNTTYQFSGLTPGQYNVRYRNDNGCYRDYALITVP